MSCCNSEKILLKLVHFHQSYRRGATFWTTLYYVCVCVCVCACARAQTWDDTLATEAKAWTENCHYEHGPMVDSSSGSGKVIANKRGQNIYITNAAQLDLTRGTMNWYNEKAQYDFPTYTCLKEPCGHYTQVCIIAFRA